MRYLNLSLLLAGSLVFGGCAPAWVENVDVFPARMAQVTPAKKDLLSLPRPKGKIKVAVYNFRDQTGQYKPLPNVSSFSTAVTQGSTSILTQILKDSRWFVPVEREGLQDLLTERKIIRASLEKLGRLKEQDLPPLETAAILIEGGVVGYDTNMMTGGLGAKYFGVGGAVEYRMDQVAVNLRAVDIRTGRVLKSVSTTKTVLSQEISAGVFRFVSFKRLLEAEGGLTYNEPVLVAVTGAIEKSVTSLIIEGIMDNLWELENPDDINHLMIREYRQETQELAAVVPKVIKENKKKEKNKESEESKERTGFFTWMRNIL